MSTIQGNRAVAHITPAVCQSAADAIAAAAAVRARRKSLFYVPQAPKVTPPVQPIEPEKPIVVPPIIELTLAERFNGDEFSGLGQLPSLDDIKVAVCNFYRVRALDLLSDRRTKDIVLPRQVAMWFGRKATLKSFPAIGRYFGGRDHSTAVNAIQKIDRLCAAGGPVVTQIIAIAESLRGKGFTVDIETGATA